MAYTQKNTIHSARNERHKTLKKNVLPKIQTRKYHSVLFRYKSNNTKIVTKQIFKRCINCDAIGSDLQYTQSFA